MKKFLMGLSIALCAILTLGLAGCGASNSSLSYTLNYNLDKLTSALEQTKDVESEEIIIPELYSLEPPSQNTLQAPYTQSENQEFNKINPLDENLSENQATYANEISGSNQNTIPSLNKQIVSREEIVKEGNKLKENLQRKIKNPLFASPVSNLTGGRYIPRRISNQPSSQNYNSYLNKVEDLYLMIDDAVALNQDVRSCRKQIQTCCDTLKVISKQLKADEVELSQDQIKNANSLLKELGRLVNRIVDTRNDVSNCAKEISSNKSLSGGIEPISSKYVTLVNCLDNRLTDYQNILAVLLELQSILTNTEQNLGNSSLDNLKDIINNNTNCLKDENGVCYYQDENGKYYSLTTDGQKEYISEEKLENLMNLNRPMIQPREIVDYDSKENSEFSEKKGNLDTYNTPTVKPNIINKKKPNQPANNNLNNESNNPSENNNTNNGANYVNNTNNQQTMPQAPVQPLPNTNTYGYPQVGYGYGYGTGFGTGVGIGAGVPGIGAGVGIGGAAYPGVHNYENGTVNPYRNTDTYKLPSSNIIKSDSVKAENIDLLQKPLPNERRQDFKSFSAITPAQENENKEEELLETETKPTKQENFVEINPQDTTQIKTETITKYNETNTNPIKEEPANNQETAA